MAELSDREKMLVLLSGAWQVPLIRDMPSKVRFQFFDLWREKYAPLLSIDDVKDLWEVVETTWSELGTVLSVNLIEKGKELGFFKDKD